MVSLKVIFLLVTTSTLINAGGDGWMSLPELIAKAQQVSEQIQNVVEVSTNIDEALKDLIPEAIHYFKLLLRKIDDTEGQALIQKLLSVLASPTNQPSTSAAAPSILNPSLETTNECLGIVEAINILKEIVTAFSHESDNTNVAAELGSIASDIRDLVFNPPLDPETQQLLSDQLTYIQQIQGLLNGQGQQIGIFNNLSSDLDSIKSRVVTICSMNGVNVTI